MRFSVALTCLATLAFAIPATASVTIRDRNISQPLVLDQDEDYYLHNVHISGITDLAALTLTGKINTVTLSHCVFSNIWAGANGKAVATESQGAIVNSFVATDTAFEDAQHQLLCLREGAFGTVTFQRCKFRTTDSFLKKIYAQDPWRLDATHSRVCQYRPPRADRQRVRQYDPRRASVGQNGHPAR